MEFHHIPVLFNETIDLLNIKSDGIYVDGTLGGAGHSTEICKRLTTGRLIAIDQDIDAINNARQKLREFNEKVTLVNDNFKNISNILTQLSIQQVDGILLDIGVSSYQLDEGDRGFSYQHNAPLDMRMNQNSELNAKFVVNNYSEEALWKLIFEYGEEKWAKRIAKFIVQERREKEIETTDELTEIIKKAIPASKRREGPHPAKRTFQAIRIEVNDELNVLKKVIIDGVDKLKIGGRLCIITFHSLEDRIVKNLFAELNNPCTCPPQFPICICNKKPKLNIVTRKPIIASEDELHGNTRARSAKLRVAEKI